MTFEHYAEIALLEHSRLQRLAFNPHGETTMTHTPAPWAYEPTSGAIYYADGDVEPVIAGINQDGTSEEQADADGYLLAAAPEMLAALKMAEADFGSDFQGPTIDAIRAAIAKAESNAS